MSTDTATEEMTESPIEDLDAPQVEVSVNGSPFVEVPDDLEAAVAVAESEGLPPVPERSVAEKLADAEADAAHAKALAWLYDVQDRLDAASADHEAKAEVAKTAKKRVESLQDDLSIAVRKLRTAKDAAEPDPTRYPLYDKAKEAINEAFPKPEAVAPLPAADIDEFMRRKRRDTRLDSIGLTGKVADLLAEGGLIMIADLDKLFDSNADLTKVKGITEPRLGKIREALSATAETWVAEWDSAHAEPEDSEPEPEAD